MRKSRKSVKKILASIQGVQVCNNYGKARSNDQSIFIAV